MRSLWSGCVVAAIALATAVAPGTAVAAPTQPPPGYLVRPVFKDCPPDTMTYPNRRYPTAPAVYACQFVVNDNGNTGNPIGVRLGRPGPLGSGAFGLVHFTTDHNLSDEAVAAVIANNAAPTVRTSDRRWLYGLTARLGDYSLITIEVVVDPAVSNVDGYAFGVVTAYCLGPTRCPNGIDEALAIRYAR